MDKRKSRTKAIKLRPDFFSLDIHKSMFINDLMITLPKYYVKTWGNEVIDSHNAENKNWKTEIKYYSPKDQGNDLYKFKATLSLSFSKGRDKMSNYRLKWDKLFSSQLAKDYPKSFVRSLEFHLGDEEYKEIGFSEFDIGGFKEQLQIKIIWKNNSPSIVIQEYFKVKAESQIFPNIFKELSSYLIADYLLSNDTEIERRIQVSKWKSRKFISTELAENSIYILLNRATKELYFGETSKSLASRYPINKDHHNFNEWSEYCVIKLPTDTSNQVRLLIERVLIATGTRLFKNNFNEENPIFDLENIFSLMNKKK
ncbi:hypothetical protein [Empedobacter brevis]|uniref:hypothetical protein n=1 Tax=Empedobacter brevis TaxID=247 RepID=UPI0039B11FE3